MIHVRNFDSVDAIADLARTATRWGRIGDISMLVDDLMREVDAKCGERPKTGLSHARRARVMKKLRA